MSGEHASIGGRMQVARLILGKTQAEMARRQGVSSKTYQGYENGRSVGDRLASIADSLQVSPEFLLEGPIRVVPTTALSFRKRELLRKPEVWHVQGLASMAIEYASIISKYVTLPPMRIPLSPVDSVDSVEDAVRKIRSELNLSDAPLRNAIDLAEYWGVLVFWVDGHDAFDGVSFWDGQRPYILLNRNLRDGYRVRFTVLHECGHLCCHRASDDVDRHEEERRKLDTEANRFASAFLMPATSFARRFPRYPTLLGLADERSYWMASCAAMIYRARQLHLIDETVYRRLNVAISAKGWRREEPNSMAPEYSKIQRFFVDELGERD